MGNKRGDTAILADLEGDELDPNPTRLDPVTNRENRSEDSPVDAGDTHHVAAHLSDRQIRGLVARNEWRAPSRELVRLGPRVHRQEAQEDGQAQKKPHDETDSNRQTVARDQQRSRREHDGEKDKCRRARSQGHRSQYARAGSSAGG
ncbi:MAG TPA: hypothetical protein VIM83_02440 [Candidatus Limnocylindria bacterium]